MKNPDFDPARYREIPIFLDEADRRQGLFYSSDSWVRTLAAEIRALAADRDEARAELGRAREEGLAEAALAVCDGCATEAPLLPPAEGTGALYHEGECGGTIQCEAAAIHRLARAGRGGEAEG